MKDSKMIAREDLIDIINDLERANAALNIKVVKLTATNKESAAITLWRDALVAWNDGYLVKWFGEHGKEINAVVA